MTDPRSAPTFVLSSTAVPDNGDGAARTRAHFNQPVTR